MYGILKITHQEFKKLTQQLIKNKNIVVSDRGLTVCKKKNTELNYCNEPHQNNKEQRNPPHTHKKNTEHLKRYRKRIRQNSTFLHFS